MTELAPHPSPTGRFSILTYRSGLTDIGLVDSRLPIVLVAIQDDQEQLHLFAASNLETIVESADLGYVHSIFSDFRERAQIDPHSLFTQLSSLSLGPLVTETVGSDSSADAILQSAWPLLVSL